MFSIFILFLSLSSFESLKATKSKKKFKQIILKHKMKSMKQSQTITWLFPKIVIIKNLTIELWLRNRSELDLLYDIQFHSDEINALKQLMWKCFYLMVQSYKIVESLSNHLKGSIVVCNIKVTMFYVVWSYYQVFLFNIPWILFVHLFALIMLIAHQKKIKAC